LCTATCPLAGQQEKKMVHAKTRRSVFELMFIIQSVYLHNGNPYGVKNEESEDHPDISVCGGPRKTWPEFWKDDQRFG
jgi:hypothetical protein